MTNKLGSTKKSHQKSMATALSQCLATTYGLYLKTQNFHWNVTGPTFSQLHLLFEGQYEELADAVDLIAERIRALEFPVSAGFSEFSKLSQIKDAVGKKTSELMLKELLSDHQVVIGLIGDFIALAKQCNDEASQDLLIERLRAHEKTAWMLRSFVE